MLRLAVGAVPAIVPAIAVDAATRTYNGASSNWNDTTKWVGGILPIAGDIAVLSPTAGSVTVSLNINPPSLLGFTLDASGANYITFQQVANPVIVTGLEIIGDTGRATYVQSGGTNSSNSFYMGGNIGSSGTYSLSGSGQLNVTTNAYVGYQGSATFTQLGGTAAVNGGGNNGLFIGFAYSSGATYNLSGGNLTVANGMEHIGYGGTATFNQSGGVNSVGSNGITIGYYGSGTYNLSAGLLTTTGSEFLVSGSIVQSGGTHVAAAEYINAAYVHTAGQNSTINLQLSGGANALYTLSNTASLNVTGNEYIGLLGSPGAFSQQGGTNTVGVLYVGYGNSANGTYSLSAGLLSVTNGATYIGFSGTGVLNQSGGTHLIAGNLNLGYAESSYNKPAIGTYNLSNTASVLTVSGSEYIGTSYSGTNFSTAGTGTFNQTGGTHTISGDLNLASNTNSAGNFNLSGGTVSANGVWVGGTSINAGGYGVLNVSGSGVLNANTLQVYNTFSGTNASRIILNGGTINAGALSLANGTAQLSWTTGTLNLGSKIYVDVSSVSGLVFPVGGSFTLNAGKILSSPVEYVGWTNTGSVLQTGGSNLPGALVLASGTSSVGNYGLSNSATLTIGDDETIGLGGKGTFTQYGGSHTIAGDLNLGANSGANGNFNMSGGTTTAYSVWVGGSTNGIGGIGTFAMSGGSFSVQDTFKVFSSGTSSATLSGGNLTSTNFDASGKFTQSAGVNLISLTFAVGNDTATSGPYTFTGGILTVNGTSIIGGLGNGIFNQSGTASASMQNLSVGTKSTGTYGMSNSAVLSVGTTEIIGNGGLGIFNQSGGVHTVATDLVIGASASGTMNLSGGSIAAGKLYVGGYGTNTAYGNFNFSAGTVNISGTSQIFNSLSGSIRSNVTMTGGVFTATSAVQLDGAWTQSAGTATLGIVTGTGAINHGGAGLAVLNAKGINLSGTTSVSANGTLNLTPTGTNVSTAISGTQFIKTLNISGGTSNGGLLDIGNHYLYVDRIATPASTVQQYVNNAGNLNGFANPNSGVAPDYSARGGITSSVARAAAVNNDYKYGIAVLDGDFLDNTLGFVAARINTGPVNNGNASNSVNFPGGATFAAIPTNRVFVASTLYGDVNADGVVNDTDILAFVGLGQYGNPSSTYGWVGGDFNSDGKVDDTDITILIGAGNYQPGSSTGGTRPSAAARATRNATTLSGNNSNRTVSPSATTLGSLNDGTMAYVYDPATGDLKIRYNGDTRINAGVSEALQMVNIETANGLTLVAGALNSGSFATTTYTSLTLVGAVLSGSIADGYDLGNILPSGLSTSSLLANLTLKFQTQNGGLSYKIAELIATVPEPTTLGLLGMGAMGLLARRRRTFH